MNELLVRVEAAVAACTGTDATRLASDFLVPVAEQHAACVSAFLARHSSAQAGLHFIGSWREFGRLRAQLSAAYAASTVELEFLSFYASDDASMDSRMAFSSAAWALIELCQLRLEFGAMVAASTADWALWKEVRLESKLDEAGGAGRQLLQATSSSHARRPEIPVEKFKV